jgi:hypothetical protein
LAGWIDGLAFRALGGSGETTTNNAMQRGANAHIAAKLRKLIKPWIVRRPNGGCQVLFPLTELDNIIDAATSA